MLVLNNLVVVQCHADDQGTEEGCIGRDGMSPSNPFAIDLYLELWSVAEVVIA